MQPLLRGWKFWVGVSLLVGSCVTLASAALMPLVFSAAVAATAATALIVAGEVFFWVSAVLLGKPFVAALTAKVKGFLGGPAAPRTDPVRGPAAPR
jgi:hypothetical protein